MTMPFTRIADVIFWITVLLVISVLGHQNQPGQQAFGVNSPHAHGSQPHGNQGQQHRQAAPSEVGHGGHGGHGANQQGVFDRSHVQDREHIKEHLDGVAKADTSTMTEQELQFHYFKMHDSDNNNKLDGCELIKSLIHWHESDGDEKKHKTQAEIEDENRLYNDDELAEMVDPILTQDDVNFDGCIDYPEYMAMLRNTVY